MPEISPYVIRRIAQDPPGLVHLPAMAPPVISEGVGLADSWRVIRRHSRLICGLLAAAWLTTGLVVFLMTPNFAASSTLLIEPEPPQVLDIKELISEGDSTGDYDYYKTQFELLKSRDLAASVIRDLDLMHSPLFAPKTQHGYAAGLWELGRLLPSSSAAEHDRDPNAESAKAIDAYLHRLTVEPKIGTRLVVVSFSAPDPILARRVVQAHVRNYIRRDLDLRNESRRSAVEFLQKQLVEMKKRVQTSEAALYTYRRRNGILSFNVEDTNKLAERRMQNLTRALTKVETKRIAAQAQVQLVRAGNYESLPQVIANPVIAALKPRVQQLQAQYADLSAAFNPGYPKLAELKAELAAARAGLQKEIQVIANAVDREYKSDADEESQLSNEISAEKERDFALNDASLQDAVLAREVETNRQLYKNVLLRMQQIAVGQRAPVTNISIVDRAVVPTLPSTPKKRRDLAISGLLALLCGTALAFIREQFDDRLKTGKEVEKYLQLPNLAVAPDFAKLNCLNGGSLRLGHARWLLSARTRDSNHGVQAIHHAAGKGDVYRSIRTALLFSRGEPPPKKVLITSAIEGEGKTWTAVHTALAFARTGAKTLLIDADLRRSRCHEALKLDNRLGLSEVLVGRCEPEDAIRVIESENLSLLSAGSQAPNASELLTSGRMLQLLDWLSRPYEYILIDSAPLISASDTLGIATMADGVVLVAGAHTPKQDVRRATELLSFVGANVLGVVLNRVDFHHADYKQYSRYYFSYDETTEEISSSEAGSQPPTSSS